MQKKYRYQSPADGDATGGGALSPSEAGSALASLFGGDQGQSESAEHEKHEQESPEAAAERIAAEEAGANHEADAEGEQQGEQQPEVQKFTVKVDGKDVELTAEQVAEAYKGQLRQADYTRKTTELAEQRKATEAETQKVRAEREQYSQQLQQILAANQFHDQQDGEWTAERIESDPVGALIAQNARAARQAQSQQAQAELQRLQQQHQYEQEQENRDYYTRQKEALIKANPDWADESKFAAGLQSLEPFLKERGFSPGEGKHMFDARFIGVLQDAKKYQDLMARAKETASKVAKAPPKVEAPGRQPVAVTDGRTQGMQRLAKSGKVDDAAALLAQMFK
jgi:hypothetical protein